VFEPVVASVELSFPSSKSAFKAYDAVVENDAVPDSEPVKVTFPVAVSNLILDEVDPDMNIILPLLTYISFQAAVADPKLYDDVLAVYGPPGIIFPETIKFCLNVVTYEAVKAVPPTEPTAYPL
jgi:hypothetical protein